jgi:hypothetical protein
VKQNLIFYALFSPVGGKHVRKNKEGVVVGFEFVFRITLHSYSVSHRSTKNNKYRARHDLTIFNPVIGLIYT